jgi:hypothetical protein
MEERLLKNSGPMVRRTAPPIGTQQLTQQLVYTMTQCRQPAYADVTILPGGQAKRKERQSIAANLPSWIIEDNLAMP